MPFSWSDVRLYATVATALRVRLTPSAEGLRVLLADPQTSGGLLVSISPQRLPALIERSTSVMTTAVIGRIEAGPEGTVSLAPALTKAA